MKRSIFLLTGAVLLLSGVRAGPAHASWVSDNCYTDNVLDDHVTRAQSQAYAIVAFNEGYEWGGGCWNDNNKDDTPNAPDSNGEGPDCGGYTFKSWELRSTQGANGFRWWNKFQNEHGPYTSDEFHDVGQSTSWPFYQLANKNRSTTLYMDAFAKDGHIGMLYTSSDPGNGLDYIAEALGDAYGTGLFQEDYRSDSAYLAIRRKGWTPDCYPNCVHQAMTPVVVP